MKIKLATQEQLENVKSEILENTEGKIKDEIDKIPPINNATDISTGVVKIDKTEGEEEAPHTVPTIGRLEEDMSALKEEITADIQSFKATTVDNKVDKVTGKGLSTNDYTTAEKNKLSGIQAGAEVNTITSVAGKTGAVTVTKGDVGLSNVTNEKQATKTEFDEHLADYATFVEQVEGGNVGGLASFSGSSLETTIAHKLGAIPTSAYCFPVNNPEGYLGEVWIRMDEVNLYVGNTGSYTGEMVWTAIK